MCISSVFCLLIFACSLPYKLREESLKLGSKSFTDQTLDYFITKFRKERVMWYVTDFSISAD